MLSKKLSKLCISKDDEKFFSILTQERIQERQVCYGDLLYLEFTTLSKIFVEMELSLSTQKFKAKIQNNIIKGIWNKKETWKLQ